VPPRLVPVIVPQITDCLVRLQQDRIAGDLDRRRDPERARGARPFTKLVGPNAQPGACMRLAREVGVNLL